MEKQEVVIETKLGKLRGKIRMSVLSNEKYYSFQGIPYGKPPIGELRFKASQPFGGWEGVKDALEDGNDCKQPVFFRKPDMDPDQVAEGDEDCLYLCVYMNEIPGKSTIKKPVMVNIHGGGFAGGSGGFKSAGPDYLLDGDVVFVSLNYRCGSFGFLSLENEEIPGNAGLKDQTLALKWVRDNIDSFGGDPDNVTIFGISAGGASVHYHILSPLSKGLFHKAIIQSGFSQNPWGFQPSPRKMAIKLAQTLGCKSQDSDEVLKFLQSIPSDDIIIATKELSKDKEFLMHCGLIFSPCVEVAGTEKFLPDTPNNLMRRGEFNKVPTILGICQNEGTVHLFFLMVNKLTLQELPEIINNKPESLIPTFFGLKHGSIEEKEAQKEIWDFYFKGSPFSLSNISEYMKFQSDLLFNIGFWDTRKYLLANSSSPTYTYLFTKTTDYVNNLIAKMMGLDETTSKLMAEGGTGHGADLGFLYTLSNGFPTPELTPEFRECILRHVRTWTKFASSGEPNCKQVEERWENDSETSPYYMDIGTSWVLKEGVPLADRLEFWLQLSSKYCTN